MPLTKREMDRPLDSRGSPQGQTQGREFQLSELPTADGGTPDTITENGSYAQVPRVLFVGADNSLKDHWLQRSSIAFPSVREARSGAAALEMILEEGCELLLVAPRLPDLDVNEFELLVRSACPGLQVVRLESQRPHSQLSTISTEMSLEAFGFHSRMTLRMGGFEAQQEVASANVKCWHELLGGSPGMLSVYRAAQLVAQRDTTVLIQGESGTGKDLLARGLHAASARAKQPFIVINCAAIPETLLEAELFGYAKGSFTGAAQSRVGRIHAAHGGTLFLDEIGDMPLPLQSKILRFLEQGEVQRIGEIDSLKVDCRVIAATHVDLKHSIESKQFREDLYYRLAVFPIKLPPLRHRLEDLGDLVKHFMARFCPDFDISTEAFARLLAHTWPGNVRELRNVMERASLFAAERRRIEEEDLSF